MSLFFTNKVTLWAASYSACVVYTKTIIHLSVGESGGYLPRRFAARQISTTIHLHLNNNWIIVNYYTASSASQQDESNRALWLATRAGKMKPSCPPGTTRCIPQIKCAKSHILNTLLTKFVRSRWLDIGLVLFLRVYRPRLRLGPWTRKKRTWPISIHLDLALGK